MRLDELFSRKSGVMVWTKNDGRLSFDRGIDGSGIHATPAVNKLVQRKSDAEEA